MYLKRVTLFGFKSFPDKIDFDFDPGVTCIVGPNGCGKSNLVDAVKWVLGEQSARSLRGKQMMDMIFNGSGTRKSSGFAQIDLLLDNQDGALATDQAEVVITRKLFRSGESEYQINKQPCRRKDIRELFMDTGIGKAAYSIIEQGKVAFLLEANPAGRRLIFEEAAGISKYKARKREAARKLERVDQNLLRAQDILQEVEKRLRSIKYQAGKARNYQEYTRQLRELRASFSLAEFHRLSQTLETLGREVAENQDRITELRAEIANAETERSESDARILDLDREITAIEGRLLTAQSELTANEERIDQLRHRIEEGQSTRAAARGRVAQETRRAARLARQIGESERDLESIDAQVETQHARIAELTERDEQSARNLADDQARIEEEKAAIFELQRQGAQLRNECTHLQDRQDSLHTQRQRLIERRDEIDRQVAGLQADQNVLERRGAWIEELIRVETEKLEEKKAEAERIDAARATLNGELATAKETRSALLSRQQVLEDLQNKMEGVHADVRKILEMRDAAPDMEPTPRFSSVVGLVGDLFDTDVEHAGLIEAALGQLDQHLVVSDTRSYLADIAAYGALQGRVHAFGLDRLAPALNARDFSDQPGFVARAIDRVRYDDRHEPLARALFGKVVIVETLDHAIAMGDIDNAGHRFITRDGQIVEPDGRVTVGPPRSTAGRISRRSELHEIEGLLVETGRLIDDLNEQLNHTSRQAAHLDEIQQALRTSLYEANTDRVENNAGRQRLAEALRRLSEERPLVLAEIESLDRQRDEARRRIEENESTAAQHEQQADRRQSEVQKLQARTRELLAERKTLADQLTAARVESGALSEKRTALAGALRSDRESHSAALAAVDDARREADECAGRLELAERNVLQAQSKLSELYLEKQTLNRQSAERRRERESIRVRLEGLAAALRQRRAEAEEVESRLHEKQLKRQEVDVRRQELCSRVAEELDIDLAEVYASYEYEEQDWKAVEDQIAELRGKIERLGNVNLDAIEEQKALEERLEFLQSQADDLTDSRDRLEALIDRLNKECVTRFNATFAEVRGHFQELFKKLFGGGKADVTLEDPDDVLESGIDIVVRPPGKELQNISLLSGGEKTLTCIALVLAVFRARPSPFTILDEVDAALDEANNERFNRIIREFLEISQFIIITHSKRTMTIADSLHGVTMQEAGVSQRVSVKFDEQRLGVAHAVA